MDSQLLIVICFFCVMLFITFNYIKKNGLIKLGSVILVVYSISIFCSIFLVNNKFFTHYHEITVLPYLYWIIVFLIICKPLFLYDKIHIIDVKYNIKLIRYICIFGLLISIIPFYEQLIHAREFLFVAAYEEQIANMHDTRSDVDMVDFLSPYGKFLLQFVNGLFNVSILFIYPLIKEKEKNKYVLLGIFMIVLTANFQHILHASRGKSVDTMLKFALFFIMFYHLFGKKAKKRMITVVGVIFGIILLLFLLISISRTNQYHNRTTEYSTVYHYLHYIGESTMNFNENLPHLKNHTNGDYCFYYVNMLLNEKAPEALTREKVSKFEVNTGIKWMIFYSFLGAFVIDIGWIGTFLFAIFVSIIMSLFIRNQTGIQQYRKPVSINLSSVYVVFLFASVIICGFTVYQFTFQRAFALFHYFAMYIILRIFKM